MAGVILLLETGAAPQAGAESIACSSPVSLSALQTAAATAVSTYGNLLSVTKVADINGNSETILVNVTKIKTAVGT